MEFVNIAGASRQGWPSVIAETPRVRVEIVPELGGKIVSMYDKAAGKEWLVDSGSRPLRRVPYGSRFVDADMSGWDECFPTVDACRYPGAEDILLPDHGELWAVPWTWTREAGELRMSAKGTVWPYTFSRTLKWLDESTLRLAYRVDNHADQPLKFVWAAHPQLAIGEPTEIAVPPAMDRWLCVFGTGAFKEGREYAWNETGVRELAGTISGNARKFYFSGPAPQGYIRLTGITSGARLACSFPNNKVPHLGIWIDEGLFNNRPVCALEPAIGYYDRPDLADERRAAGVVPPRGALDWHLDLAFGGS
jgi:hypothetical protein